MKLFTLLGDVCSIIARTVDPQEAMNKIVKLVATRLSLDGCSLYLREPHQDRLTLRASAGRPAVIMESIAPGNASTGEDALRGGLESVLIHEQGEGNILRWRGGPEGTAPADVFGLPLPLGENGSNWGLLVLTASHSESVSAADVPSLATLARRIGAVLDCAGFPGAPSGQRKEVRPPAKTVTRKVHGKRSRMALLAGVPVSCGFAEGTARRLAPDRGLQHIEDEEAVEADDELKRFQKALILAREEMLALKKDLRHSGKEQAEILEAHLMLLDDVSLQEKVASVIRSGKTAEHALKKTLDDFQGALRERGDAYLRERAADVEGVGTRLLGYLLGKRNTLSHDSHANLVAVGEELSVLDLLSLRQRNLRGVVLSGGGQTTHSSIIAQSLEIPMVIGVENLENIQDGDRVIVDAESGLIFSRPPPMIRQAYREIESHKTRQIEAVGALKVLEARTTDGFRVRLGANIGLPSDLEFVEKYGADHIGLYRTEYPFLAMRELPSEDSQFSMYREVMAGAGARQVTFRTLDVGGDKLPSSFEYPKEHNPHLGWRSIRVCLEMDEIFRTQIRAILRASAYGKLDILLPMITSVEEIRKANSIIREEKAALSENGHQSDPGVRVGVLVEVPGTVKILHLLLRYADFVSIGTNDLIQYTLAADRGNLKVAPLHNPFHPAVLSTVYEAARVCRSHRKDVSVCGESASMPACAFLYLAMGIDGLSMNPARIPAVKAMIRASSRKRAVQVLQRALEMETGEEIENWVRRALPTDPLLEMSPRRTF